MARSRTFQFDSTLAGYFMAEVEVKIADVVKAIATDLLEQVQSLTPVKTGCLKASWVVGDGAIVSATAEPKTDTPPQDNAAVIREIDGKKPVYISNSLPYAFIAEFGGTAHVRGGGTYQRPGAHMLTTASLMTSGRLEEIIREVADS